MERKNILYLSFYFEPDLCAGSFRNSPLVAELSKQCKGKANIDVITTVPNRYGSFSVDAPQFEKRGNCTIHRVFVPAHQSGMKDQVLSFKAYYSKVKAFVRGRDYDLVVASSSRLFTAYLGYSVANKMNIPLYLDIRDIFYDTLEDVLKDNILKKVALPIIKLIERKTFNYATHINLISGGFKKYFEVYSKANYSFFPNGIDDLFIENLNQEDVYREVERKKTIVYAGNIGEGQGLHKIIPKAAKALENDYKFLIIGDGGAKQKLIEELKSENVSNVQLQTPVQRDELLTVYQKADFLFAHLNNFKAFEKVLPSKLFELATFNKPLIAGVGGFASDFVKENIDNSILFEPCNIDELVAKLKSYTYKTTVRKEFISKFKRSEVNRKMAKSMLKYI